MTRMLDELRAWWRGSDDLPGWQEFTDWARTHGWTLRRVASRDGWAMDRHAGLPGCRIEWGPSQRSFMSPPKPVAAHQASAAPAEVAHELRIRIELPRWPEVQALVLDRSLLARLDREVYQQFTGGVQTRLDDQLPEEMRWLAMHAKLGSAELGLLRERYGALGNDVPWLARWLGPPFSEALMRRAERLSIEAVTAEPLTVRLARGQLLVRQGSLSPTVAALEESLQVARAALESALRDV